MINKTSLLQLAVSGLLFHGSVHAATERPNIVVVLADDMGWGDSATYGNELIKTPNMDNLAKQGLKFNQCYSAAGVCSPSRSAILTGRTPYRNGVWRHLSGSHEAHLRASEITYPTLLKNIGYETCHVGKWHLLSKPQFDNPEFPQPGAHGYDYWMASHNNAHPSHKNPDNFIRNGVAVGEMEGYSAPLVADEAIRWLKEIRNPEKPFVLSVWFHEPHSPIATDIKFADIYGDHENKVYMGNITQMDFALGQLMKTLDEVGEADNTLLVFSSDNGGVLHYGASNGELRGGKRSSHEGGIRVPGLIRWPKHIKPGTVSETPIIGTDLFTTILDIVDVELPKDRTIDGVSILPLLKGEEFKRETPLYWRTHVSKAENRSALRMGDWKLVSNDVMNEFQLFNIQKDWKENNDLSKEMPEKLDQMKKELFATWESIEKEGPKEWWQKSKGTPKGKGKLVY